MCIAYNGKVNAGSRVCYAEARDDSSSNFDGLRPQSTDLSYFSGSHWRT